MPPFMSVSKAFGSFVSLKMGVRHLINSTKSNGQLQKLDQIRRFSGIAGLEASSVHKLIGTHHNINSSLASVSDTNAGIVQSRRFLGCGDGEEGDVLSKVYEERIVLGYSPEQLFDVVAAVDFYQGFVPWCQRSEIMKHYPDGSFDAELEIGFKFLVESYVSHVEIDRPKFIKTTVSQSALFDHLINIWKFNPGTVPGSCNLYFLVDFKFQSPIYRQVNSCHGPLWYRKKFLQISLPPQIKVLFDTASHKIAVRALSSPPPTIPMTIRKVPKTFIADAGHYKSEIIDSSRFWHFFYQLCGIMLFNWDTSCRV